MLFLILRAASESVICLTYSIFESPSVRFVTGFGTGFHPPKAFDIERTLLCESRLNCAISALIDRSGIQPIPLECFASELSAASRQSSIPCNGEALQELDVREHRNQKYAYGHGALIPLILLASSYR